MLLYLKNLIHHQQIVNNSLAKTRSYDAVDRITGVDNLGTVGVPNVFLNYVYDSVGNLLSGHCPRIKYIQPVKTV